MVNSVSSPERPAVAGVKPGFATWLALALAVLACDQITKIVADALLSPHAPVAVMPFFNLTLMYNEGAAFSFLSDAGGWQRWFFITLSSGISVGLVIWLKRLGTGDPWLSLSLALVLGGAVGNLVDRMVYGHVVDFLDVYYRHWHWPAFNIADSAITVGAVVLIAHSLFSRQPVDD